MNAAEHSSIVFLLDAIQCSPEKSELMLKIIEKRTLSHDCEEIINEIRCSKDVLTTVSQIRKRLR